MSYRLKLVLFVLCCGIVLFVSDTAYQALNTLSRLNAIETERDSWQRPADVIHGLNLKPGNVVVDLGCGSGYFTLKLSSEVGVKGRVLAEDIRRLPLVFLWVRAFQRSQHNVTVVHGKPNDPRLPLHSVNAVLIANTYHEFADAPAILAHVAQSLVPGGTVVVVDRQPRPAGTTSGEHEISAEQVESDLIRAGFEISGRQDRFIEKDPYGESWWLISARSPE